MRLTMCKQQLAYNMYCYYTLTNWDAPPQKMQSPVITVQFSRR